MPNSHNNAWTVNSMPCNDYDFKEKIIFIVILEIICSFLQFPSPLDHLTLLWSFSYFSDRWLLPANVRNFLQTTFAGSGRKRHSASIKVCSESLDTKSKNWDNSEDLNAIKKIFLEIEDIVKKHIFYLSISEKVQKFALKSQK